MRSIIRFLLILVLAFSVLVGQGNVLMNAWANCAHMSGLSQKAHSCCDSNHHCQEQVPDTQNLKAKSCQCAVTNWDVHQNNLVTATDHENLAPAANPNPTHSLQLSDADIPVWLYWHFYPDQSDTYLQRRRLLL